MKLFAIDELHGNMFKHAYSRPLTTEFLKEHKYLVVDTKFFNQAFKDTLLASFANIDEECDGLLIHSENFQALNLIQNRYKEQIKCIYIDPPYNAKTSEILYKNTYKHASWLSMMNNRLLAARALKEKDGVFICAIDENEQERLGLLLSDIFPSDERVCISVVHNPRGIQGTGFSFTHEYAFFLYRYGLSLGLRVLDNAKSKPLMKTGSESERSTARNCFYPIIIRDGSVIGFGDVPDDSWHPNASASKRPDGTTEVWPISSSDGLERKWRYARQSVESIAKQLEVRTGRDGKPVVNLAKDYESYRTVWSDAEFNAAEHGSTLLKNILGNTGEFSFPKSIWTVTNSLKVAQLDPGQHALDFFAGSGTTGHAVINLNRSDKGKRKYILVEMGEYFNTVTKPRIQKVIYSADWKDGKPVSRVGSSHMFKYLRLESYEDTLNNVQMQVSDTRKKMFDEMSDNSMREEYVLGYMLDVESRDSASLLNQQAFTHPFDYQLDIAKSGSVAESVPTRVDMVETFNYLIGLRVQRIHAYDHMRLVAGTTLDGLRTLVVWRDAELLSNQAHFTQTLTSIELGAQLARDYDVIYVNGDSTLASQLPDSCKVRSIDTEFHARMFADTSY